MPLYPCDGGSHDVITTQSCRASRFVEIRIPGECCRCAIDSHQLEAGARGDCLCSVNVQTGRIQRSALQHGCLTQVDRNTSSFVACIFSDILVIVSVSLVFGFAPGPYIIPRTSLRTRTVYFIVRMFRSRIFSIFATQARSAQRPAFSTEPPDSPLRPSHLHGP